MPISRERAENAAQMAFSLLNMPAVAISTTVIQIIDRTGQ
jgi:hypothetical protein